jgi:fatty acid desaturase
MALAWATPLNSLFWVGTVVAGIFYTLWLFCTHDAAHHTLLGRPALEEILARLISWPILWPVGVYSELHRLHHGWNGLDLRDPERYQPSEGEYQQAAPWMRWYMRHQWIIHIFVLGGLGIIVKTVMDGRRFQNRLPRLKWQLLLDGLGMLAVHTCLIAVVIITHASMLRYLLFWVCLERVVGGIAQVRAHLEHYGLWHPRGNHQLTQLYASRNLHTSAWFSWLIGGLNYHGVHHGFPNIPFDQLPEAHQRVQRILDDHGLPSMNMEPGYFRAINRLINSISLIPDL